MSYPANASHAVNGHHPSGCPPITVLCSSRAVVSGRLTDATVVVSTVTGKIVSIFHSILPASDFPPGTPYEDFSPCFLLPGLVDAHVHLNEPGRTEWEGFRTGTIAAASGGVTTLIDMPLNAIPPTTTVSGLKEKIAAARGQCWVDVGFYGGVVPGNQKELKELVKEGVRGFKAFMIDSGVSLVADQMLAYLDSKIAQVDEFPAVSSEDIKKALAELADQPTTLMFHAEMIPPISASVGDGIQTSLPPLAPTGPLTSYQTFLDSRPPSFETYAIAEIISLASLAPRLPLHVVHLSAVEAIPLLREARAQGIKITAETCFHYLSLAAEEVKNGDTRHKCCPPIRTRSNQDGLWAELVKGENGVIQTVVSDHSPCTPNLKLLPASVAAHASSHDQRADLGDFFSAWGGVSSVGLGLSILWTEARSRNVHIEDIVKWCCRNTAKQVGLDHQKGDIAVGLDADLVVFDDEASFVVSCRLPVKFDTLHSSRQVEPNTMLFRNKCSPYEKRILRGTVVQTWLRGTKIFSKECGFSEGVGPIGKLLLEPRRIRPSDPRAVAGISPN